MSDVPKLILLSGPPAIGKSTIAKKYIDEHPFTLIIDDDQLIGMMGGWKKHEATARKLIFELTKSMAATYLRFGHSVLVPYLVLHPRAAEELEEIAEEQGVDFYECVLLAEREEAIKRLLARGRWGEAELPPISRADLPYIHSLHDQMEAALQERPRTKRIQSIKNDIEATYQQFMVTVES